MDCAARPRPPPRRPSVAPSAGRHHCTLQGGRQPAQRTQLADVGTHKASRRGGGIVKLVVELGAARAERLECRVPPSHAGRGDRGRQQGKAGPLRVAGVAGQGGRRRRRARRTLRKVPGDELFVSCFIFPGLDLPACARTAEAPGRRSCNSTKCTVLLPADPGDAPGGGAAHPRLTEDVRLSVPHAPSRHHAFKTTCGSLSLSVWWWAQRALFPIRPLRNCQSKTSAAAPSRSRQDSSRARTGSYVA